MSKTTLPFDELNKFRSYLLSVDFTENTEEKKNECVDALLDILILSYIYGTNSVNKQLQISVEPNEKAVKTAILKEFDGKNFADRVSDYFFAADIEKIFRVAETESHRVYCDAQINTAYGNAKYKTWVTKADDRVRDTHDYIEGVKIGVDEKFYTYDGDEALYPGGFEKAQNNINCRCVLEFSN